MKAADTGPLAIIDSKEIDEIQQRMVTENMPAAVKLLITGQLADAKI